jgi:hypothetical protein
METVMFFRMDSSWGRIDVAADPCEISVRRGRVIICKAMGLKIRDFLRSVRPAAHEWAQSPICTIISRFASLRDRANGRA